MFSIWERNKIISLYTWNILYLHIHTLINIKPIVYIHKVEDDNDTAAHDVGI